MAYEVNNFNGSFLTSVADGTIDTTTDLRFIGKNYAGYGEVQNENFLHLLQNFSNVTAPPKAIAGQIWFDSSSKKLKIYDGSKFKIAGGAEVSDTAPSGLSAGDFWWDSVAKQLYAYTGSEFTLIGPITSPELGTSTIQATNVYGTTTTDVGPHSILKVIVDDKVIGIYSKTEFTLDNSKNPIEDFTAIKKGYTLAKTSSTTGVSVDNYIMWGTTSNSLRLGGYIADDYVRKGEVSFTSGIDFSDLGFQVGEGHDLRVWVNNGDEVIVENRQGNPITFRITVAETTDERDVAIITSTGVVPGENNSYSLGTSLLRWNNVYSTTFTGNLIGNVTGNSTGTHTGSVVGSDGETLINGTTNVIGYIGAQLIGTLDGSITGSSVLSENSSRLNDLEPSITVPESAVATIPVRDSSGTIYATTFSGNATGSNKVLIDYNDAVSDPGWSTSTLSTRYRTAKLIAASYSIAARDVDGNITANVFNGTATAARYADLAEKYLADKQYEPGTVVSICEHEEHEVEACQWGQRAIGVVSTNPAFMMNKDLEGGTYIALKGRVPCKVSGAVKKGQRLVAGNDGTAVAAVPHANDVFGVALETNNDTGIKTIEVLVL